MNVKKLAIEFDGTNLVDINFTIERSLALVGQSGSGKSLSLKALLNMLPQKMTLDLDLQSDFTLVNGKSVAYVPQNPFTALSPLTKIKEQFFIKPIQIEALMKMVDLDVELLERYAPELSGGQLQRVVIAMALSSKPKLLMLDEPTTALDPDTRVLIIELLRRLQNELGFKMLFVTHDMNSAEALCDEICIIKDGLVVEHGLMQEVVSSPSSEFTKMLVEANFSNRKFRE
ncbi:MAG: ATP-binding cassette domain-containing protein [Campylobacterota bacterium]|nr:ATP-binding cassette domain-containing protein [Campylobacterota bacterium]